MINVKLCNLVMRYSLAATVIWGFVTGTATSAPLLTVTNAQTHDRGGSFEVHATFELPDELPCEISAYSINLQIEELRGIDGPFLFESTNIVPEMYKIDAFSTADGELDSGGGVTVVACNDPVPFNPDALSVSASLQQISPLARIDYSIPQSSEYSFIVSLVDTHSQNLIGSKVPHLSTKAIRFSVPEPKGIQTLAVPLGLLLFRCSRQPRACLT